MALDSPLAIKPQSLIFNLIKQDFVMHIKTIIHDAEEGGFWAEVPAIPGCVSQGETMEELLANLREAIEGCLAIDVAPPQPGGRERILDLAI